MHGFWQTNEQLMGENEDNPLKTWENLTEKNDNAIDRAAAKIDAKSNANSVYVVTAADIASGRAAYQSVGRQMNRFSF